MESGIKTKKLRIDGMTCMACQNKIERKLRNTAGVQSAKVSYSAETADVTYDTDIISLRDITAVIEKLDYTVLAGPEKQEADVRRVAGILMIVVSLYVLLSQFGILNLLVPSQLADTKMGYGMLFVIGLITSVHCIAMCGGINLSQCIPQGNANSAAKKSRLDTFLPAFLYNLGRVVAYTTIGFVLGFAGLLFGGGAQAGLPILAQGVLKLFAGAFMVIMGINMLGIFPVFRKLQPRMPKMFARKIGKGKAKSKSPFVVGLLNGLMPCGPLQSMQIVALASGNPFAGALSMFLFSLGTVPLMLGFGSIVSALGKKFTAKVMSVGAVLVVVLGLAMISQGGSLSGFLPPDLLMVAILLLCSIGIVSSIPFKRPDQKTMSMAAAWSVTVVLLFTWNSWSAALNSNAAGAGGNVQIVDGKQVVKSTLAPGSYPSITVQAGTPVKWIIDAPQGSINGCNNRINIKDYDILDYSFQNGENIIEFTPEKTGRFQYSCWMGMIQGNITVVEAGADTTQQTAGADAATGYNEVDNGEGGQLADPIPAGYTIPTDDLQTAKVTTDENGNIIQEIAIELTDDGFRPAVAVVTAGLDVKWNIKNSLSGAENGTPLLIPNYATQLIFNQGDTPLYFFPESSFEFSTGDNRFYGYIKVVEDADKADAAAIREEVRGFETLIYPPALFAAAGGGAGGASCH